MDTPLAAISIRTPLDAVRARQRARQLGGLLGLQGLDRAALAGAVFALAEHQIRERGAFMLRFETRGQQLVVRCQRGIEAGVSLVRPLPAGARLATEDLAWAADQLEALTPVDLLEEIQQVNRDLLAALHELHAASPRLPRLAEHEPPAAAA